MLAACWLHRLMLANWLLCTRCGRDAAPATPPAPHFVIFHNAAAGRHRLPSVRQHLAACSASGGGFVVVRLVSTIRTAKVRAPVVARRRVSGRIVVAAASNVRASLRLQALLSRLCGSVPLDAPQTL